MEENQKTNVMPTMADVFEAYRRVEAAKERRKNAAAELSRAKKLLDDAKSEKQAADGELAEATAQVLECVGEMAPKDGKSLHPMGWIDSTTRPGRRYKLRDSEDRIEFKGFDDGRPIMVWFDGLLAGESFFPAGDVRVAQWNEEYAPKVEGYVDAVDQKGETEGRRAKGEGRDGKETENAPPDVSPLASRPSPLDSSGDDSWRAVKLDSLADPEVGPRTLKAMAEHEPPIVTIGDLADWQAAKGDFWAKDIHGVGPGAADKLADALEKFWKRRREGRA